MGSFSHLSPAQLISAGLTLICMKYWHVTEGWMFRLASVISLTIGKLLATVTGLTSAHVFCHQHSGYINSRGSLRLPRKQLSFNAQALLKLILSHWLMSYWPNKLYGQSKLKEYRNRIYLLMEEGFDHFYNKSRQLFDPK